MKILDVLYLQLFRLALRITPHAFRERNSAEMLTLVRARLAETRRTRGNAAAAARAVFELIEVARVGVTLRRDARSRRIRRLPLGAAGRRLVRHPAFFLIAVCTLALGVGAATAVFGVLDAILLRPLPYPDSDRLTMVWRTVPSLGHVRSNTSYLDYLDWKAMATSFEDLAFYGDSATTFVDSGVPERLDGASVSGSFFPLLRVPAARGRYLMPDDDTPGGGPSTIVLSDGMWRQRFGADPQILGRSIILSDRPLQVVGVMPPGFAFPNKGVEYWMPLRLDRAKTERSHNFLTVIGRLEKSVTLETASEEMNLINRRIAAAYPGVNADCGVNLERRLDYLVHQVRGTLLFLAAAVAVLLIVACANVTNLQLMRAIARRRELSVKRALGASSGELAAESLAEGVWLALASGALAVALTSAVLKALAVFAPALPRGAEVTVGWRVIAFAGVIAAVAAMLSSVLPMILRSDEEAGGGRRSTMDTQSRRAQSAFVVIQIAMALALVIGSALFIQSFRRLLAVPRGFQGDRVLSAKIMLPGARYSSREQIVDFYSELLGRLQHAPGVEAASGTWALPFSADDAAQEMYPADRPAPERPPSVGMLPIREGYFRTIGTPLLRGREFTDGDRKGAPRVTIVNETLARQFWGTTDVVGKQVRDEGDHLVTVVGVVADLKRYALDVAVPPEAYLSQRQVVLSGGLYVVLRGAGDPMALLPALKNTVTDLDPRLALTNVGSMSQFVEATLLAPRFRTALVAAFALTAGLLALIGVYSTIAFMVTQRRHEIAIRGALGAVPQRILAEVLGSGMRLGAIGVLVGLAGAAALSRVAASMLFGISTTDARTYAAAAAMLLVATAAASFVPARRAALTDPVTVLRQDETL